MMYLLKHKTIAVITGGLLVFSACKKDSDSGTAPVIEPLSVAAAKPNDTLTIKGQNFDATASGNVVKVGDVQAVVVSASATEIKVVIPAIGLSGGSYTITVTANGQTTQAGSIVIAPLTFYAIKGVFSNSTDYQVITINPQDGSESLVASVGQNRINDVVYLPVTNEIIGVNDNGTKLIRVNVTTKQVTTKDLTSSATINIAGLVVDKDNNLYGIKYDFTTTNHQLQSLIKIDPATGNSTVIKTFESTDDWYEPVYVAATNEVVGIKEEGTRLLKVNLTTKDTSSVYLPGSANKTEYRELIVDNKSNVYAYKAYLHGDPTDVAKLVKVNTATGQETGVKDLPVDGKFHDKVIFVPQTNEFMGTWEQRSILRLNATSLKIDFSPAPPLNGNTYNYLTTN